MPKTIDCHKADERVFVRLEELNEQIFVRLQEEVPQSFGRIEYLIAYNNQGKGFLFTVDGNDVETTEGQVDIVWKTVIEALDLKRNMDLTSKGEPERKSRYQRIESFQEPNMIWHKVCSYDCDNPPTGDICLDVKISIPVRKERQGADITAGYTFLSGVGTPSTPK